MAPLLLFWLACLLLRVCGRLHESRRLNILPMGCIHMATAVGTKVAILFMQISCMKSAHELKINQYTY